MTKFLCWIPDYGHDRADAKKVVAFDAGHAAELFMEKHEQWHADYPVASGGSIEVAVSEDGGDHEMYLVTGDSMPHYNARHIAGQEK